MYGNLETCKRALCDFNFLCQETFAKQRSPEEIFFNLSGSENLKKQGSEKRIFFARLDFSKLPVAKSVGNSNGKVSANSIAKYSKIYVAQKRLKNKVFY